MEQGTFKFSLENSTTTHNTAGGGMMGAGYSYKLVSAVSCVSHDGIPPRRLLLTDNSLKITGTKTKPQACAQGCAQQQQQAAAAVVRYQYTAQ
jgi:hypothetical protein